MCNRVTNHGDMGIFSKSTLFQEENFQRDSGGGGGILLARHKEKL